MLKTVLSKDLRISNNKLCSNLFKMQQNYNTSVRRKVKTHIIQFFVKTKEIDSVDIKLNSSKICLYIYWTNLKYFHNETEMELIIIKYAYTYIWNIFIMKLRCGKLLITCVNFLWHHFTYQLFFYNWNNSSFVRNFLG